MKRKIKKSNILIAAAILYIFTVATIKVFYRPFIKEDIGITTHKLSYIGCVSAEDKINLEIVQGDTNKIDVTQDIEMFYSSGCLSLYGKGTARLTVERNTIQEIYAKNNAVITGETGDSIKFIQASEHTFLGMKLPEKLNELEMHFDGDVHGKFSGGEIKKLKIEAANTAVIKIFAKVDNVYETKSGNAKVIIKNKKH